ncbi:hypothetical protein BGX38DRAFT_1144478 [Terfezia claveryi]|nr:hypothetical protein BGX38DRAFT_1144478 [Terfezia claveryi]
MWIDSIVERAKAACKSIMPAFEGRGSRTVRDTEGPKKAMLYLKLLSRLANNTKAFSKGTRDTMAGLRCYFFVLYTRTHKGKESQIVQKCSTIHHDLREEKKKTATSTGSTMSTTTTIPISSGSSISTTTTILVSLGSSMSTTIPYEKGIVLVPNTQDFSVRVKFSEY